MISRKPIACLSTVLCLCLSAHYSSAQDKAKHTFGKLTPADFTLPATKVIDSNADAVILYDIGDVHYIGNKYGWFSYVYKRQTRIRILNSQGLHYSTIGLSLRGGSEHADVLSKVEAATYNLENGQVVETKLDSRDVYMDKPDKYRVHAKFSMPAVKKGSIIEYTYTTTSSSAQRTMAWCTISMPRILNWVLAIWPAIAIMGMPASSAKRIPALSNSTRIPLGRAGLPWYW